LQLLSEELCHADRAALMRLLEATVSGLLRSALLHSLQASSTPAAKRRAVAALRLMTALATDTRLRFDGVLLQRLLPHLFRPLAVDCMCKVHSILLRMFICLLLR
jgi:hypothetical protein